MLISFFLRRILQQAILCFVVITFLLAASNVFVRLPGIVGVQIIPILLWVMLPMVALFALPLACPLAVQIVIGNLLVHDELLFLFFVKRAKSALYKALLLFSLITVSVYVPLVFFWAPASYSKGKQLLIGYAYEQLRHLEAETFHSLADGVSVYFTDKVSIGDSTQFSNIFLVLSSKNRERYFFTAQQGELLHEQFELKQGSLIFIKNGRCYSSQFTRVLIDMEQLWNLEQLKAAVHDVKFKIFPELAQSLLTDQASRIELWKRISQVLWQLLLPFIALFFVTITSGQNKNTLLKSIVVSGLLFFIQYMTLTLAQAVQQSFLLASILFFLPPFLLLFYGIRRACAT